MPLAGGRSESRLAGCFMGRRGEGYEAVALRTPPLAHPAERGRVPSLAFGGRPMLASIPLPGQDPSLSCQSCTPTLLGCCGASRAPDQRLGSITYGERSWPLWRRAAEAWSVPGSRRRIDAAIERSGSSQARSAAQPKPL